MNASKAQDGPNMAARNGSPREPQEPQHGRKRARRESGEDGRVPKMASKCAECGFPVVRFGRGPTGTPQRPKMSLRWRDRVDGLCLVFYRVRGNTGIGGKTLEVDSV